MAEKSYLKNQIKLISLNANDTFTEDEYDKHMEIIALVNKIDQIGPSDDPQVLIQKNELIAQKKQCSAELTKLIAEHKGYPRKVRLESVIHHKKDEELPAGVTWYNLKLSKRIAEFESEMSRAMGLTTNEYTFDKIIIKWKNLDLLEQIVVDGITMDILNDDGRIIQKKYRFFTASAGQLRRDKIQMISEDMWFRIKDRMECGLTWDYINAHNGCNVNKKMAYDALPCSSTDPWLDFDIDRAIVVDDWIGEVTGLMMYIYSDYSTEIGVRTVEINHVDGAGMMLPTVSKKNFMVRAAYMKGLLCVFDFIKFCEVHGVEPVIKDRWGLEHNLVAERINIIFTDSMLKMGKYYESWDHYKREFKKNGCQFGKMKYEEDKIPNKSINYQMLQTLTDFTDEEIKEFTNKTHERLMNLGKDKDTMLKVLKAENPKPHLKDKVALKLYPELLRDGYNRQQLKDTKRRMLFDAKSGVIKCKNKRLYAIPDWYAFCEHAFMGIDRPEGLLKADEVACKPFRDYDKADVLRSPHLYMEHFIVNISHDPKVYEWFTTDGIVTSCHSLISRVLQFDVDGDELNVVVEPLLVKIAERNIKEYNVIPLFYDAGKAPAEILTKENVFKGLKRAHECSNIGEISNMLTRLWNRDNPDRYAAALITRKNNAIIDAAKTGYVVDWTHNKELTKRINRATGGKTGKMPYFFSFSKNGRKDLTTNKKKRKWAKTNQSTMNRICAVFDDIGNINMNWANIPPFNWQMLVSGPCSDNREDIVADFCDLDNIKTSIIINTAEESPNENDNMSRYGILEEHIAYTLIEKYGSLEFCYPYIVKHLFTAENENKPAHKQTFWRIFGDIAVETLKHNLEKCYECPKCNTKVPEWVENHVCITGGKGFFECVDCHKLCVRINAKQCRCPGCQEDHRVDVIKACKKRRKEKCTTSLLLRFKKT